MSLLHHSDVCTVHYTTQHPFDSARGVNLEKFSHVYVYLSRLGLILFEIVSHPFALSELRFTASFLTVTDRMCSALHGVNGCFAQCDSDRLLILCQYMQTQSGELLLPSSVVVNVNL